MSVRLPAPSPLALDLLLRHFALHVVPGVESWAGGGYAFSTRLPLGMAVGAIHPDDGQIVAELALTDGDDRSTLLARLRLLLDVDADSAAIDAVLGAHPALAPLVTLRPGVRLPGAIDAADLALRTVVGQQVSLAGAITLWRGLVTAHGEPLPTALIDAAADWGHQLDRLPPTPDAMAALDPLALPMPKARARCLVALATALADGSLDLSPDRDPLDRRRHLEKLPGIGNWSSGHIAMRGCGDRDVDLSRSDLIARRAADAIDLGGASGLTPWRSYVTQHLWVHALTSDLVRGQGAGFAAG